MKTRLYASGVFILIVLFTGSALAACPVTVYSTPTAQSSMVMPTGHKFIAYTDVVYRFEEISANQCRVDRVTFISLGGINSILPSVVSSQLPGSSCSKRWSAWGAGIRSERGEAIISYHARVKFYSCATMRVFCCKGHTCTDLGLLGKHCVPRCGNLCTAKNITEIGQDTFRHDIRLVPRRNPTTNFLELSSKSEFHGQGAADWAVNLVGLVSLNTLSKWYNDTLEAGLNEVRDELDKTTKLYDLNRSDGIVRMSFMKARFRGQGEDLVLEVHHLLEPPAIGAHVLLKSLKLGKIQ